MRYLPILLLLIGCQGRPVSQDCAAVRAHVIDSLKAIYEQLNAPQAATLAAPTPTLPGETTGEVYTDSKGQEYPIYRGSKGGRYYMKISGKTGKPYKVYLKEGTQ